MTSKTDKLTGKIRYSKTTASEASHRRHPWLFRTKVTTPSGEELQEVNTARATEAESATFEDLKKQYLDKSVVTHGD
ncbi:MULTISPECIES: hypothetical protein [Streptacidiphilus]|uniref:Uncharacterized protein n=1 Tax=Streptacidiphilus cavernicola TaxID=3342716 RepID=A0ABV6UFX6_9ACTN|nr:hypothetical protein [Streptacidiphilus jeojiense]